MRGCYNSAVINLSKPFYKTAQGGCSALLKKKTPAYRSCIGNACCRAEAFRVEKETNGLIPVY